MSRPPWHPAYPPSHPPSRPCVNPRALPHPSPPPFSFLHPSVTQPLPSDHHPHPPAPPLPSPVVSPPPHPPLPHPSPPLASSQPPSPPRPRLSWPAPPPRVPPRCWRSPGSRHATGPSSAVTQRSPPCPCRQCWGRMQRGKGGKPANGGHVQDDEWLAGRGVTEHAGGKGGKTSMGWVHGVAGYTNSHICARATPQHLMQQPNHSHHTSHSRPHPTPPLPSLTCISRSSPSVSHTPMSPHMPTSSTPSLYPDSITVISSMPMRLAV